MSANTRKWVILIPVVIGVAALVMLKKNQREPVQEPIQEKAKLVRVITTPSLAVVPQAKGHGTVKPSRTWEAVAQVKGKIVHKHPQLQKGSILEADTLVLRIDPTDYELAIAQAEADILATEAQLQELDAKEANTRSSLKIEQAALALNQKELERKSKLIGKGSVSRSDLEGQERSVLSQQQSVQAQKNTLNLIPSQRALLEAQLARHQATLASARRNLANTEIRLPFTSRIAEVNVEQDQYVREGEVLTSSDDLKTAEIETQIPINQMSALFHSSRSIDILNAPPHRDILSGGISVDVKLQENGLTASWQARLARLSDTLDPKTRTVGVIVEVNEPYANVQPGIRPPLVKGLFVEVSLAGKPRPDSLVIPRSALHNGNQVYVSTTENRLDIRDVEISLLQPEFAVLSSGIAAGEQLVVSDLIPAIKGMLLQPQEDSRSLERLHKLATGGKR
jgi:multidrug efflux system membrane fusion protein